MEQFSVLIADDIKTSRIMLRRLLERIGIERIIEAEDGLAALDGIARHLPDLVLLDINMPGMDGTEVLANIKNNPDLRNIPVIMITVMEDLETAVRCIESGAEDHLSKPYNPVLLRARVKASLERKRLLDMEKAYLRSHDAATGLPNRHVFQRRIAVEMKRYARHGHLFSALVIRLNRYPAIADGLGTLAAEDYILQQSRRLKAEMGPNELVVRLSEHELGVLIADIDSVTRGHRQARDLAKSLQRPVSIGDHRIGGGIAIGVVYGAKAYRHPDELIRDAGLAAKRIGEKSGFLLFDEKMHAQALRRLALEQELGQAIDEEQLHLAYQPIVSLTTNQVVGFEALLRWTHPQHGVVMPDQFIGLAEENGMIIPIGNWVLKEAIRQMGHWQMQGLAPIGLTMNVNVSARQFLDESFLEGLCQILNHGGYDGQGLRLELTETAFIDNPDRVVHVLNEVRGLNLEVALDDFGTGYCSLSYLHDYPFDMLKIDRSFVQNIDRESKNRKIVHSTIELAHRLQMAVVAEGVESDDEAAMLQQLACEYGQGKRFHVPLVPEAAAALLLAG